MGSLAGNWFLILVIGAMLTFIVSLMSISIADQADERKADAASYGP